jgi:hypothetical protein
MTETKEKGENGEDLKIFTIRIIPEELRKKWKICCTILSCTMEQFAVDALREKVDREFAEMSRKQNTISTTSVDEKKENVS